MKKIKKIFIAVLTLLSFGSGMNCRTAEWQVSAPVESQKINCKESEIEKKKIFSILFGAIQLNGQDFVEKILNERKGFFIVRDEVTSLDLLITVLGGTSLSITSSTRSIMACPKEEDMKIETTLTELPVETIGVQNEN